MQEHGGEQSAAKFRVTPEYPGSQNGGIDAACYEAHVLND
jgi:hypothetical protein